MFLNVIIVGIDVGITNRIVQAFFGVMPLMSASKPFIFGTKISVIQIHFQTWSETLHLEFLNHYWHSKILIDCSFLDLVIVESSHAYVTVKTL